MWKNVFNYRSIVKGTLSKRTWKIFPRKFITSNWCFFFRVHRSATDARELIFFKQVKHHVAQSSFRCRYSRSVPFYVASVLRLSDKWDASVNMCAKSHSILDINLGWVRARCSSGSTATIDAIIILKWLF